MATSKRGRRGKQNPPPEEEPTEPELEVPAGREEEEPDADDVLGEIDDESRFAVSVFRKNPSTARLEYVGRMSPAEFSLDMLRERYGGGVFEVRTLRRDDRTNREKIRRTRTVHIAGAPRAIVTEGAPPAGGLIAVVPPPQSETERRLLEELERSRRARMAMRRKLEELQKAKTPSLLKELAPILAPILAPFFRPAKGGTEEFMRALELGVKLGSRGGGEEGGALGPIIDKALGVVTAIAQNGQHPHGSSSQPAPGLLPGSQNGAASPASPAVAKVVPLWIQRASPYFPVLLSWARAGDDPAARVGFVLGALDETTKDELGKACEAEDFVTATLGAFPPHFREPNAVMWTTRFLQLVQEQLAPVDEEAPG